MKIISTKILISSIALIVVIGLTTSLVIVLKPDIGKHWETGDLIDGTAATFAITGPVQTSFGSYIPLSLEFTPSINPTTILPSSLFSKDSCLKSTTAGQ